MSLFLLFPQRWTKYATSGFFRNVFYGATVSLLKLNRTSCSWPCRALAGPQDPWTALQTSWMALQTSWMALKTSWLTHRPLIGTLFLYAFVFDMRNKCLSQLKTDFNFPSKRKQVASVSMPTFASILCIFIAFTIYNT